MTTYTNSALACARECLRKYRLRYDLRLELDRDEDHEALTVGTAWHLALEFQGDPSRFDRVREAAPSELWAEKLVTLAVAYDWYWGDALEMVAAEVEFQTDLDGIPLRGKIDGVVRMTDGRVGIIEHKTTSADLSGDYWQRLRLDTQVGIYSLACRGLDLFPSGAPDFIVYDVVRKPTIRPKAIPKAEMSRLFEAAESKGVITYEGHDVGMTAEEVEALDGRESPQLYGLRLLADITEQPEKYFGRREVHRTTDDYDHLLNDIAAQVEILRALEGRPTSAYPRNPDACNRYSTCDFWSLCSANQQPNGHDLPDGYRRRDTAHAELTGSSAK